MLRNQKRKILGGLLLILLAAGGFFYVKYWSEKQVVVIPKEIPAEEEKQLLVKEEPNEEGLEEEVIEEEVKKPEPEEPIAKAQSLIAQAKELILRIENFLREEAYRRSSNVKGVYMNEFIANSQAPRAKKIREDIKKLLDETELNAVVIDVKEAYGPNLPISLKKLIDEFHHVRPAGDSIWVIARICAFRDSSLIEKSPELYLKTKHGELWRDWGGGYWLDPANPKVQDYIIEFSKKAIDFGFDELQFDYIRYSSDPFYPTDYPKHEVIRKFFLKLSQTLKDYKPSIILSVDVFGYLATQFQALDIGLRLKDVGDTFDYISPMLYPSHFYGGFQTEEINIPYPVVSEHPFQVVYHSIISASNYLSRFGLSAKIRPWLQDFDLKVDIERGVFYDEQTVRAQIQAAEDSGASGWLLWNPDNIYTEKALK